ncbi:MAG: HAD family hydrolase [Acidobacteria bacterium]|nr:MAG: HAD family hydrolase [Acidobacteriota bacterium]
MRPSRREYRRINVAGRAAYIRRDRVNGLSEVEAIIFDCDGVLIDTRRSYDRTIGRAACFILDRLAGFSFPRRVITSSIIYTLRGSGGFNSDWDSTYVILLYLFSRLPKPFLLRFHEAYQRLVHSPDSASAPAETLQSLALALRGSLPEHWIRERVESMRAGLSRFVAQADHRGISSLEKRLWAASQPEWRRAALDSFKALLGYPERAGQSLLATVFDEIFYGARLFQRVHRRRAQFHMGPGAIENETVMIKAATLRQLVAMVGSSNVGIASGRGSAATEKTLGRLLDYFNPRARVHLEDEELLANHHPTKEAQAKPAPYALLKSARAMKRFTRALYVGDSAEDIIMARRANEVDPRFLFAGVTSGAHPEEKRRMFVEARADAILSSVNQLPRILRACRQDALPFD